ncbi:HlyD family secretion protein [Frigoriflavimonas asaccharolytica]|uniref:Membrane fusion protein (Multidrug efflux system) n=1 Tax=Frigoriflavimonas asaccharolytica TaxID=2735899 RepID=A0A8J8G8S9_9FLAO|nr:HlyD family secretion protein [Frigoriflavimonas asaccharolytica]NRS93429.1 membrane fusion protein (multidrug efflux system) [Frigoriflavimonas asaccharolytica]
MDNNIENSMENEEVIITENNVPKKKKGMMFPIILGILILTAGFFGYRFYKFSQVHEETDDAQIAANLSPVISKVSGYVDEIRVKDNQFVKKGDTLIILENKDQKLMVEQAEAALGTARSNISSARATSTAAGKNINTSNAAVQVANAQIEAAKVNVRKTSQDLVRYSNLVKDNSITRQQYDNVLAAKQSADAQLRVLIDTKNQISQQTGVVNSQTAATSEQIGVASSIAKQREVDVANAKQMLAYTVITASQDGFVSKIPVQKGQFLQAGAQLFSLVLNTDKWIIANFKETQLSKMVEGQKVEVEIDAFPSTKFEGTVSSFSPATGSTFSILPPDNASGNFVKVVQRLPVKIDFKNLDQKIAEKLRAGMNVKVTVSLD